METNNVIIELDAISFKAISEFFESLMICYYSLKNWRDNIEKMKFLVIKIQELYFDYIKEILKNPYTEINMIYDSLIDSQSHFHILKKWDVFDERFEILFLYLTHFYKIKFININTEISINFLHQYNNEEYYVEKGSIVSALYKKIREDFNILSQLKKNSIFNSISLEYLHKLFIIFFKNLEEMILLPTFELKAIYLQRLIEEMENFPNKLLELHSFLQKAMKISKKRFFNGVRFEYIVTILDKVKANCFTKLIGLSENDIMEKIQSYKTLKQFKMKDIQKVLKAIYKDLNYFKSVNKKVYEKMKMNLVLKCLTFNIMQRDKNDISENISYLERTIQDFIDGYNKEDLQEQMYFIKALKLFFNSIDQFAAIKSLSSIVNIIDYRFTKTDLLQLINKKDYEGNSNLKDFLISRVTSHFKDIRKFNLLQKKKRGSIKRFKQIANAFLVISKLRVKRRKTIKKMMEEPEVRKEIFVNKELDEKTLNSTNDLPILYQILNKRGIKKFYNGVDFESIFTSLKYEQGVLKLKDERIYIYSKDGNLKFCNSFWKIKDSGKDISQIYFTVSFYDGFIVVMNFKKNKAIEKIYDAIAEIKKKKHAYFETHFFSISTQDKLIANEKILNDIYKNTKFVFYKPRIFGKTFPKFFQSMKYYNYDVFAKKKKKVVKKIKRRKSIDVFKEIDLDDVIMKLEDPEMYENLHKKKDTNTSDTSSKLSYKFSKNSNKSDKKIKKRKHKRSGFDHEKNNVNLISKGRTTFKIKKPKSKQLLNKSKTHI